MRSTLSRVMKELVSRNKCRSAVTVWRAYRDLERMRIPVSLWYLSKYAVPGVLKYLYQSPFAAHRT